MKIETMSLGDLVKRVRGRCRGDAGHPPPFTLVLGSGFSYGIIPTTSEIVRADLPWWTWCQRGEPDGPKPGDYVERKDFDAAGLPTGDGIGEAYRFALSSACGPPGLYSRALVRGYFGDIIRRAGRRMNAAHLFLAALIAEKPRLFGTIFTTNFDTLLQRSLQLVNAPYYVSDRPDTMEFVEDDSVADGVHVVHAHGSIHRYLLLNSPTQIAAYAELNRGKLEQYFRRHAVLIVGYSGWDDAITQALARVGRFDHELYWTGRSSNPEESDLTPAAKNLLRNRDDAFYVPVAGADALMVELYHQLIGHSLPLVFREPILVAQEQLDQCDLTGVKLSRGVRPSDPARGDGGTGAGTATTEEQDLGEDVLALRKRLGDAQGVFSGNIPTDPEIVIATAVRRRFAVASDLIFSEKYREALPHLDYVVNNSEHLDAAERALARFRRGYAYGRRGQAGDLDREIEDFSAVIDAADAPAEQKAEARRNRGYAYGRRGQAGDLDREIEDFSAVIDAADAPAMQKAKARYNRGYAYGRRGQDGDVDRAITDYTAVIDAPDDPANLRADATRWRDQLLAQQRPPAPEPAAPPKRRASKKRSGGKKAEPPPEPPADPAP